MPSPRVGRSACLTGRRPGRPYGRTGGTHQVHVDRPAQGILYIFIMYGSRVLVPCSTEEDGPRYPYKAVYTYAPTPHPSKRPPPHANPVHGLCDFAQATATLARALRNPPNVPGRYSRNRAFLSDFQYNVLTNATRAWSVYFASLAACSIAA